MKTQLKTFEYEGKVVDYGFYRGSLVFNLNSIGSMVGITKPQMSIDTNDSSLAVKLTNESFASDPKEQMLPTSESISTYFRTLHNTGELFLTEAGLQLFLSKSRKVAAKNLLEWMFTNIPKIKEQIMTNEVAQVVDNNIVFINNVPVVFMEDNERILVSSRDVAAAFEKRHDNVLKIINELPKDDFRLLNFKESSYINNQGKVQPEYKITRDGFSMLIMSFTGAKAYRWKKDFIAAFNRMEVALKQQSKQQFDDAQHTKLMESLKTQLALEQIKLEQIKQSNAENQRKLQVSVLSEIRDRYREASNDIGTKIYDNLLTEAVTGKSVVSDLAVKITEVLYTATEVGEILGISSRLVGRISNTYNLKTEEYGEFFWEKASKVDKLIKSFKYNRKGLEAVKKSYELYLEEKESNKKDNN